MPKNAKTAKKGKIATAVKTAARKITPKPGKPPAAAHTLSPYLAVNDAARAIDWYRTAFGAKKVYVQQAGGKVMHAHLRIGDSDLFLADIFHGADLQDASRVGASTSMHLWSRNADKWWSAAVANGAKVSLPYEDQFWGDKYGKLIDPFGHNWAIAWKSKLSPKELEALRVKAMSQFGA